jgi:hypothetical protein
MLVLYNDWEIVSIGNFPIKKNWRLEPPVLDRAGTPVRVLNIHLCQLEIFSHHLQRGMSEDVLQSVDVSAPTISQFFQQPLLKIHSSPL